MYLTYLPQIHYSDGARTARIGTDVYVNITGQGFRSTGTQVGMNIPKCIFVDVGIRNRFLPSTSLLYVDHAASSFSNALLQGKVANETSRPSSTADYIFEMSDYVWIDHEHVTCKVPNTKGVARTMLVAVTPDFCLNSSNILNGLCGHLSTLNKKASVTFIANTTRVSPNKGPQGSKTEIEVSGYGFRRLDTYQTITLSASAEQSQINGTDICYGRNLDPRRMRKSCISGAYELYVPVFEDGFDLPSWNTVHGKWFGMPDQESYEQGKNWLPGPDSVSGDNFGKAYNTVRSVHTGLVDFENGGFRGRVEEEKKKWHWKH